MIARAALAAVLLGLAAPALADEELRPLCADRPGIGTPPCIVDRAHVVGEVGLVAWTATRDGDERTDTIVLGDLLARYGLDDRTELLLGWTAFGRVRSSDASGVETLSGIGDVTIGLKRSLRQPDGSGFSVAVQPLLSLPTGSVAIGARDWGARLMLPIAFTLNDVVQFSLTPEIDAVVDTEQDGHHPAYGGAAGLGLTLTDNISTALEVGYLRDEDPAGTESRWVGSASLAWQVGDNWQLDAGTVLPIDTGTRGVKVYFGVARRF